MMDMASAALEEVVKLIQTNEPLWLKSASIGTEVLQSETYERIFQRPSQQFKFSDTRTEASRDSALVIMDAATLVDMFMDSVSISLALNDNFFLFFFLYHVSIASDSV